MNVKSVYSSSTKNTEPGAGSGPRPISADGGHPHLRKVTDHVILSARARAVLVEMRERPELDSGINSGLQNEGLGARRAYQVVGRLEQGYYREPHVLQYVASRVGRDVTNGR